MKRFNVKSPSGCNYIVIAESMYHAVQKIVFHEGYKYSNSDYLKLSI